MRLVELDVGGGFGARGEFYPEDFLIPFCAMRAGRPVQLDRGPRGEPPRAQPLARADPRDRHRPARRRHPARPARPLLLQHGRLRAHPRRRGPEHERGPAARPLPLGRLRLHAVQVVTNKTPAGTYRAPGRYEANFVRERMLDMAAPAARDSTRPTCGASNLIARDGDALRGGHARPTATRSCSTAATSRAPLDRALECFGYEELLRWRAGPGAPGRRAAASA